MANYFTTYEMRCKGSPENGFPEEPYPEHLVMTAWPPLRESMNEVREDWADILNVLSGYRSPPYNAFLREQSIRKLMAAGRTRAQAEIESGVAEHSKHMEGIAVDLRPRDMHQAPNLHRQIITAIKAGRLKYIGGVGLYPTWVHIDTRPRLAGGAITQWGHA
jgi:uncharacterized protein YcbK (DUF882 family)